MDRGTYRKKYIIHYIWRVITVFHPLIIRTESLPVSQWVHCRTNVYTNRLIPTRIELVLSCLFPVFLRDFHFLFETSGDGPPWTVYDHLSFRPLVKNFRKFKDSKRSEGKDSPPVDESRHTVSCLRFDPSSTETEGWYSVSPSSGSQP